VIVTTGSSGGFPLAFLASFDAGDRVALAAPGYPAYRNILAALNLEAVDLPTTAEDLFQPTVAALEKAGRIDGLIVASPSNPTGTMVNHAEMKALAQWCDANGVRLVSDEIYHGIVYEGDTVSAVEVSDTAIVVNSFSKYFSMTGWRVGWLVVPPDLVRPIERLAQNFFISVPTLSQHAALAAFECREELDGHVKRYRTNRDLLLAGLRKAGFESFAPAEGAFYLYADVRHLTNDSREFCSRMLKEAGVATTPGVDFDRARGAGTLRISFAGATAEMEEAVRRLEAWKR
jgi:aspartate/methionine/tyrosine aminotransferase